MRILRLRTSRYCTPATSSSVRPRSAGRRANSPAASSRLASSPQASRSDLEDGRQIVALDDLGGEDLERQRPLAQRIDEVLEEAGIALGRVESVEGAGVGAEQVGDARPEPAARAPFAQQLGQAAEVAVDQHLVDAGLLGDGVDADGAEAVAGEDDADRAEDARLGRLAVACRALGHDRFRRRAARARRRDPGSSCHRRIVSGRSRQPA